MGKGLSWFSLNLCRLIILLAMMFATVACSDGDTDTDEDDVPSIEDVDTGLARVYITTPGAAEVKSKEKWLTGATIAVYDSEGTLNYKGSTEIKGRGNMSWTFPKKSYAIRLKKKGKVLDMPEGKRWCLMANWLDRTLMRNAVAFRMSTLMGALDYTPRGEYVELFVNGEHRGNYYLCEQIKIDSHRVPVEEPGKSETAWPGTSGGYIFELDEYFDEDFRLRSPRADLPWMLKDPDEVGDEAWAYVKGYVAELEDALYDEVRFARRDFARMMDLESFADWWFVHELTMNREPRYPKSCYMHKHRDTEEGRGLLMAGPVWDFDCETFDASVESQFTAITCLYYPRLFEDAEFRDLVKRRWERLKEEGLRERVCEYIDALNDRLRASESINSRMWPVTTPSNTDILLSWDGAVAQLKETFTRKYLWMDYAIRNL